VIVILTPVFMKLRHSGAEISQEQWDIMISSPCQQRNVLPQSSCLHYLLPDKRDPSLTASSK